MQFLIQGGFKMHHKKSVLSKLIFPLLLIFLSQSFITGCGKPNNAGNSAGGSTPNVQNSSQSTKAGNSSTVGAVTYENYLKIKPGMTYDNVKSILGAGIVKNPKSNPDTYTWGKSGKTITVQINQGKVVSKAQTMLGKTTSTLTADQFNKIKKDMTFDQTISILGPDYQESSYKRSGSTDRRVVMWMKPDTTNVTVVFQDDKVNSMYNFLK